MKLETNGKPVLWALDTTSLDEPDEFPGHFWLAVMPMDNRAVIVGSVAMHGINGVTGWHGMFLNNTVAEVASFEDAKTAVEEAAEKCAF